MIRLQQYRPVSIIRDRHFERPSVQRPHPEKYNEIMTAAAALFAAKPFHAVRLEDIAAAAGVGKGTLYVYFRSKDELYIGLIRDGFARVVGNVREGLTRAVGAAARLGVVAGELVEFAFSYPDLFRVMRSGSFTADDSELQRSRRELTDVVTGVLREGNATGELADPFPELTAQFLLSFVRGAALYPPAGLTKEGLQQHVLRVMLDGVSSGRVA